MNTYKIHNFDTPGLSAIQFLYALMCNPSVPIMTRIQAADALMRTGHGNHSFVQAIKVKIGVVGRKRMKPPAQRSVDQRRIHLATVNGMNVA
jgi:hypothetical protein